MPCRCRSASSPVPAARGTLPGARRSLSTGTDPPDPHSGDAELPPPATDLQGRTFTWVRLLGRGAYGDVYLAWMLTPGGLDRLVAVKLLHPGFDPHGRAAERLRAEAAVLARLHHPVVVAPLDVFAELGGRAALVTEFIEGQDLADCIDPQDPGRLPASTLLEVVEHVASALEMAWRQLRVIHRDVKPHNIRIGLHGNVKLLDFGVARSVRVGEGPDSSPTTFAGTLAYLAPERFDQTRESTPASDVYALGCVLYQGVVGESFAGPNGLPPTARRTPADWARYLAERLHPVAHDGVRALLLDMLAHAPEARPTAQEVGERCAALTGTFPAHVRLARWCRERRWPDHALSPPTPASRPLKSHVPVERLREAVLTEEEEEHVTSCFPCQAHRRALLRPQTIGPYQLLGRVGHGAMGDVYAARDADGTRFALKVLHDRRPGMQRRIAREARLQRLVDHPHVLSVIEVLEHEGSLVLVLPFVPGPTLGKVLSAERLPEPVAAAWFTAIVDGVAALHALGLVHRDLKPANVLLDLSSGTVVPKVADFGLAKALYDASEALTGTGVQLGTMLYAAPEQWRSAKDVDARADVYALGRIAAELFGVRSATAVGPWAELVRACTEEDRTHRPLDAGAVRALLPAGEPAEDWTDRVRALAPAIEPVVGPPDWQESVLEPRPAQDETREERRPPPRSWPMAVAVVAGLTLAGLAGAPHLLPIAHRVAFFGWSSKVSAGQSAPELPQPLPPTPVSQGIGRDGPAGEAAPPQIRATQLIDRPPATVPPAAEPEPVRRAPVASRPVSPPPLGKVWVKTRPWGHVSVGGQRWDTEDQTMRLPAGPVTLTLTSFDGKCTTQVPIVVAADGETRVTVDFAQEGHCSP